MYMKLKEDWPAFKAYKLSEEAKARSARNAENAKKKKYNHTMDVVATLKASASGPILRRSILLKASFQSRTHGMLGAGIGSTGMGARWTRKGNAYITSDTKKIPYTSRLLEMQSRMLERDGSSSIERMTSSHRPWEMQSTQDGYEPQKARSHGRLGFPRTGRDEENAYRAVRGSPHRSAAAARRATKPARTDQG